MGDILRFEFNKQVMLNYDENWSAINNCFKKGLRCNRQALEIQSIYNAKR